ncbi:TorF family putative porin [Mariprofundus ferrooxydans]|nr:TorF family putative porin [Mariprofundus ferrooxydans]KON48734.1 hypothetical protein AL013_01840 [Mariprofundus ferrooxydans]
MKLKRYYITMMMAGMMGMTATAAQAEESSGPSFSGDIGVMSQYVFRGVTQTTGKPAVQGDLNLGYGGFTVSTWFSNAYPSPAPQFAGRDTVEFDFGLDYSGSVGGVGYSLGAVQYTYLYDSASNYAEGYASLSYDAIVSPSAKVYYTIGQSQNKAFLSGDTWVDLGLSTSYAGLDFSGSVSYARWKKDSINRPLAGTVNMYKDGFNLVTLGMSKDVTVGDATLTASLTGTMPVGKKQTDGERYIYGVAVKPEVVAGLSLSY